VENVVISLNIPMPVAILTLIAIVICFVVYRETGKNR